VLNHAVGSPAVSSSARTTLASGRSCVTRVARLQARVTSVRGKAMLWLSSHLVVQHRVLLLSEEHPIKTVFCVRRTIDPWNSIQRAAPRRIA
jgi:hypothetical protein